jgi:drug/metabolite transporter (DMT)-like permease
MFRSHLNRGYGIALLAAAVLSTTAIFIRYLTQTYHMPLLLAFWRDGLVALILLPGLAMWRPGWLRVGRPALAYLAGYGLLLAAFNGLWTLSVALNGAAVATVLVYCSTAFTVLLGWAFLKERLDGVRIAAVVLSVAGCALVAGLLESGELQIGVPGIVTGVLAGLGYAVYSLMGRSASRRGLNPWATLAYTFGFATLFLLAANLLPGQPLPGTAAGLGDFLWLGDSLAGCGILVMLAAGPTILGFGLYNVSLTYLPSGVANLIVSLEPALTALIAYVALGEWLTGMQIAGGLLILGAVVILRLYEGRVEGNLPVEERVTGEQSVASD